MWNWSFSLREEQRLRTLENLRGRELWDDGEDYNEEVHEFYTRASITEREIYLCTSLDRPRGLKEIETPRNFRQSAHESGKDVSLTHRPPLPAGSGSWYSFLLEAESTPDP
jgi:hypothetical protein